jgi:hypothetical protein
MVVRLMGVERPGCELFHSSADASEAGRKNNGGVTSDNVQRVNSRGEFEPISLRQCNPMERGFELDPDLLAARRLQLAYAYHLAGREAEAVEALLDVGFPPVVESLLREASERSGLQGAVRTILELEVARTGEPCPPHLFSPQLYLFVGERESALECLQQQRQRGGFFGWAVFDPGRFAHWGIVLIYTLDPPCNLFPSVHLAIATLAALVSWKARTAYGAVAFVFVGLIAVAICTTKQHYVVDGVVGVALALFAYALVVHPYRSASGVAVAYGWRGPATYLVLHSLVYLGLFGAFLAGFDIEGGDR